jgi:hypothetical protein
MYPVLREAAITRQMITAFAGFNNRPAAAENEFCHMENLTADQYPLLATRGSRTQIAGGDSFMETGDTVVVVTGKRGALQQINDIFA